VLYINPKTWRVDPFLFTVLDFAETSSAPYLLVYGSEEDPFSSDHRGELAALG
jgi:hypothetical protein